MVNARLRYFNCIFGAEETQRKVAEAAAKEDRASASSRCSNSSNADDSVLGSSTDQWGSPRGWAAARPAKPVGAQWDGLDAAAAAAECGLCTFAHACPVVRHRSKKLHRAFIALTTVLVVDEKMQKQGQLDNSRAAMLRDLLCAAHAVVRGAEGKTAEFAPSADPTSPGTPLVASSPSHIGLRSPAVDVPARSVCAHVMASTSVLRVGQKTALLTTYAKTVQKRVVREVSGATDPFVAFAGLIASARALFADGARSAGDEDLQALLSDLERSAVSTAKPEHHAPQEASLVRDEVLRLATRVLSPGTDGSRRSRAAQSAAAACDAEQSASSAGSTPPVRAAGSHFPSEMRVFASLPVTIESAASDANTTGGAQFESPATIDCGFDSFSSA
ncbi:hypothetical protein DIPPA_09795 [Diplonema papillatum]|nr:hypothetical protein DIPPA_09795 [Diplonema papillatum]|eukprot:gene7104-10947_t